MTDAQLKALAVAFDGLRETGVDEATLARMRLATRPGALLRDHYDLLTAVQERIDEQYCKALSERTSEEQWTAELRSRIGALDDAAWLRDKLSVLVAAAAPERDTCRSCGGSGWVGSPYDGEHPCPSCAPRPR